MKITVIYFSGTGNTFWVCTQINKLLGQSNEINIYSVENPLLMDSLKLKEIIVNSDHIILGFPIYASRMPKPIKNVVDNFPVLDTKKSISIFATQATASGDGAVYFKNSLKKKGYVLKQSLHLKMGNNFYIPHLKISPVKGENHLKKLNKNALVKIEKFCNSITLNKRDNILVNPLGKLLGITQRAFYDKTIEIVSNDLIVNDAQCNNCGFCINNCPAKNIVMENDKISFKDKCIACVRCYNFCPKEAILLGEKTNDSNTFYRYKGPEKLNILKIMGNNSTDK